MNDSLPEKVERFQIIQIFELLVKWKKVILVTTLLVLILGIALAVFVRREYKSVARILPPKESNILSGLTGISSLVRSLPVNLGKISQPQDTYDYVAILRSRTVLDSIIVRFDLLQVYDISDSSFEKAQKAFKSNTEIDWTEENTLEIRVWDIDASRAANMANYYVDILNRRSYELQTQEAHNTRMFIEERVKQNQKDLFEAEQALKKYQEQQGMIISLDPSSSGISSIAGLYADKVKLEIELGMLERVVGTQNSEYREAMIKYETLKSKMAKLPEIGISTLRLYRDVMIQQKIMELVVPLYEQAKVNEHKDVPVAYVLDRAIPGERPDRPKRLFIVGIALLLGLVLSLIIVSIKEYSQHLRNSFPDKWEQMRKAKSLLGFAKKKNDFTP